MDKGITPAVLADLVAYQDGSVVSTTLIEKKTGTAALISQLLKSSGIKSMVPARLNEMTKRGLVFKPDPARPEFKLTMQGEKWIDVDVLPRLRTATG